jgi:hypothetical protein
MAAYRSPKTSGVINLINPGFHSRFSLHLSQISNPRAQFDLYERVGLRCRPSRRSGSRALGIGELCIAIRSGIDGCKRFVGSGSKSG